MTFVHSGKAHLGSRVVGGLTTRRVRANSWMPTRRVGVHLTVPKSLLREQNSKSVVASDSILEDAKKAIKAFGMSLCASIVLMYGSPETALAGQTSYLTVPVAKTEETFALQRTLVEAWTIVSEAFVDPSFNHLDWYEELRRHLINISQTESSEKGVEQLKHMVAELGDPFTRWVPASEYQEFRMTSDGEIKGGVGLLIASDPLSGNLVVLAPIKGSPAERAGIHPGDQVISVNGTDTSGLDGEEAARILRGEQGSSVEVEIARVSNQLVPGQVNSGMTEDSRVEKKRFRMRRERVNLSPIFATAMHYDDHTYGYVRLVSFSQKAANEMKKAVSQLKKEGAEAFILDLRNNPGGLVTSSLDIANVWLDGKTKHPVIFSISGRPDPSQEATVQNVALSGGIASTELPLVVLVNKQSASASEILAGALHDNGRALVVGESTFGKGKIQSVFELNDGSALFVTVANYKTPNGTVIDKKGISPDFACSLAPNNMDSRTIPDIPIAPGLIGADSTILEELETDSCIKSAEILLGKNQMKNQM